MPMIEVTAPRGALTRKLRDPMMQRLTDTVLKWEGAPPSSAAAQNIAWAYYNEVPEGFFYVGGVNPDAPRFRLEITTPQGAFDDARRAGVVHDVAAVLDEFIGAPASGLNHWILLREIQDGSWATAGRIVRHADIKALVVGAKAAA